MTKAGVGISLVVAVVLVASVAYEIIRFAGRHDGAWYGRVLMAPGFLLQSITTREPDDDQIEVAVAALRATVAPGAADPQPAAPISEPSLVDPPVAPRSPVAAVGRHGR